MTVKMIKYFDEVGNMYQWLDEHPEYKMIKYSFTFAYGYQLVYEEKTDKATAE